MTDIEAVADTEALLKAMRSAEDAAAMLVLLRRYVYLRLRLPPDTQENNVYNLVVYSVKLRLPGTDGKRLEARLATTDCHQTSYVVSRKTLLMMEIEQGLGVSLTPEQAKQAKRLETYAELLWEVMRHADG
jgi:hypothetical protein